jgi:hypothetical protein
MKFHLWWFCEKKTLPMFEQVAQSLQNHFEHSSVGCWPLVSGGGNSLDIFFSFYSNWLCKKFSFSPTQLVKRTEVMICL